MNTILFVVVLVLPDQYPIRHAEPVASIAECLFEAHEFIMKPSHRLLIEGGQLQVSCVTTYEKSEEH